MDLPNFREESRYNNLFENFSSLKSKGVISLWQNINGSRKPVRVVIRKTNRFVGFLNFSPFKEDDFLFDSKEPIYFYEKNAMVIFKSKITFNSTFNVQVAFPCGVLIREQREGERFQVESEIEEMINQVKFEVENDFGVILFEKPLIDYGLKGASFRVSSLERNLFVHTESLILNPPHETKTRTKAKVIYVHSIQDESFASNRFCRVGVEYIQ